MAEADKSLDRYTDQYNNFYTHTPPNFLMVELSFPVLESIKQSPNSVKSPPPPFPYNFIWFVLKNFIIYQEFKVLEISSRNNLLPYVSWWPSSLGNKAFAKAGKTQKS